MGKPSDAEYEFNEAIRLQPQNPEYHFDLGEAFAGQFKWKSALTEYETALSLEAANPLYMVAIANVYLVNNNSARALELMEQVVAAHPDASAFQYYLAWAIHDETLKKWSVLPNDKYVITSPAQIEYTEKATRRALSLKFDDAPLRKSLEDNMRIAQDASQVKWFHSSNLKFYIGGIFVGFLMLFAFSKAPVVGLLGLALIVGSGYAYNVRHHIPTWKHTAQVANLKKKGIE
jgi:tetratricopeptide (TPR) repeat protein